MRCSPPTPSAANIIVTLLITSAVLVVGLSTYEEITGADIQTQYEENRAAFEEFCHAQYGDDAVVYIAGASLNPHHSGLHCNPPDRQPTHLSQIPRDTWTAYKAGHVDAEAVANSIEPMPPFYKPYLDSIVPVTLMVLVVVIFIGLLRRLRSPSVAK